MTINNTANKVVAAGNGVMTVFNFSFVGVDAADISVIYTDANGNETTLATTQYTLALNAVPPGQIWGIGGTVTYPLTGSPIALNTTLTILRTVPLLQKIALGNQGNEFPSAVEAALDLVTMMVQQVNELFQRAIVAPVVDPSAPLPLPPAAQRANQALVFDGNGNPIAGAIPGTGVISTAMQPVVNAATLAAGRTAFGLGAMAVEGIGAGLQDDGSGNARVNSAVTAVATNQSIHIANHLNVYAATGALTFTLDRANTLFDGFNFTVYALTAAVTITPNASDNFFNLSSGASLIIPKGSVATFTTDAATTGTWYPDVHGVAPVINIQKFTAVGANTYTPSLGLLYAVVECVGGGGGGGGCAGSASSSFSGGGGGAGGYSLKILSATQIGSSQTATVGGGGSEGTSIGGNGGPGGATSFGTFCSANPGQGGSNGLAGNGGLGGTAGTGDIAVPGAGGFYSLGSEGSSFNAVGGAGGDTRFGSGGRGPIADSATTIAGNPGIGFGTGGSGAALNSDLTGSPGGAGAAGIIVVTEYLAFAA